MAFLPFSGWKDNFFGDMHAQGRDVVASYTEKKVVVERWPKEWSRRFSLCCSWLQLTSRQIPPAESDA